MSNTLQTPPDPIVDTDLSDPSSILTYLSTTPFASTRAEPLSGGNTNFIFRLHLIQPFLPPRSSSGNPRDGEAQREVQTAVLKHAKSWVKLDENFECAVERQETEAIALTHVRDFLPSSSLATVPQIYHHDPHAHVLIMEDAGPSAQNLKDLLRSSPPLSEHASRELGAALGRFIAAVHVKGSADKELLENVERNKDSRAITAWITYGRLVDTLKGEGQGAGLIQPPLGEADGVTDARLLQIGEVADTRIKSIHEARTHFTMSDFWTGNIVVRLGLERKIERIYVVDWEIAKPGLPFIDFAQFTAEMNTLRRFHPDADASVQIALSAYMEAYKREAQVDETFMRSAAFHVGAHMVTITPTVRTWGPKPKVREVVKEGVDYLLGGIQGDAKWLKASVVGSLLDDP